MQSTETDGAVDLRTYLEVELATTRIALKKAKRSIFLRWHCNRLHRQEVEYERAIAELRKNTQAREFLW